MKKGGRVSAEEKRTRATEFFLENPTIFNLKELEAQQSRQKGIISQSVKDLQEELVVENVIEKEKLGSGNYFWCFPSKSLYENSITQLEHEKQDLLALREPTSLRAEQQKKLVLLNREELAQDAEQAELAASDPSKLMDVRKGVDICRQSANRWTENIFQLVKFYKNRMSEFNTGQFQKHFNLPEDLEEL